MKKIILGFVLLMLFTFGCQENAFSVNDEVSKVVVSGFLFKDSVVQRIRVYEQLQLGDDPYEDVKFAKEAKVSLIHDDKEEVLMYDSTLEDSYENDSGKLIEIYDRYFGDSLTIEPDKKYTLKIEHKGNVATSTIHVPKVKATITPETLYVDTALDYRDAIANPDKYPKAKITFDKDYFYEVNPYVPSRGRVCIFKKTQTDSAKSIQSKMVRTIRYNGNQLELPITKLAFLGKVTVRYKIRSPEYYDYYQTTRSSSNTDNDDWSKEGISINYKNIVSSNINNGLGIFTSVVKDSAIIVIVKK